ncbi:MAG: lipoprotein [Pseudomonadota bacterium]
MRVLVPMAVLAALVLSGCGVRGSLEAPPQAQASSTATSAETGEPQEGSAAPPKRHRGFILDGLLR